MKCIVFLVCLLSILIWNGTEGGRAGAADITARSEHVILVIIDGLRYTEGLGDPDGTHVPEMHTLSQGGAIIEPFLNDGYTYTSQAVPAIWCGTWTEIDTFSDPDCGGMQNNYTSHPTLFEYFRRQLARPEEDCVYVLPDVGCPWKGSFFSEYGPDYWPLYHSVGDSDLDVWREARDLLVYHTPTFLLLYLADVDHGGHSGDWNAYLNAIETADGIIGMLWDFLQATHPYAGTTTLLVTNDHGRHSHNFSGHGCGCDGCRTIQLLAVGPGIRQGLASNVPRTLCDITPTVGALLGFSTEYSTGEVMEELFEPAEDCFLSASL